MYSASVIIPTYNRDDLLAVGLQSIRNSALVDIEIIVINDGLCTWDIVNICRYYNATHLWQKRQEQNWRNPGIAFNIGVNSAQSDIIVLTSPEMLHIDDCLSIMIPTDSTTSFTA